MFKHPQVRSQRVALVLAKNGTMTRKLVLETNAEWRGDSDLDDLVEAAAQYVKGDDDLDSVEIHCRKSVS